MTDETASAALEAAVDPGTGRGASATAAASSVVVVAATHALVADTVRTALASRGFAVEQVAWPAATGAALIGVEPAEQARVGIVLADIESESTVTEVGRLVAGVTARWLLLTSTPPGPLWGAALERGADAVGPSSMTLDELVAAIGVVAQGGSVLEERYARALRRAWHEVLREEETLRARMR